MWLLLREAKPKQDLFKDYINHIGALKKFFFEVSQRSKSFSSLRNFINVKIISKFSKILNVKSFFKYSKFLQRSKCFQVPPKFFMRKK